MRATIRSKALAGSAAALLILGTAACTNEPEPEPTPTIEAAPTDDTSDGGGTEEGPAESSAPAEASGECEVKEGDTSLPKEAPPVDAWQDINGSAVPVSETYGPFKQDADLWTCYEHSPLGAAFAAHYALAATGSVSGFAEAWIPDSEYQAAVEEQESTAKSPSPGTPTPAGFRLVSYSDDKAVVDVVTEIASSEGSALISMRWTLIWQNDSWKVDPNSVQSMEPTTLPSLDGFVTWGRVNG